MPLTKLNKLMEVKIEFPDVLFVYKLLKYFNLSEIPFQLDLSTTMEMT